MKKTYTMADYDAYQNNLTVNEIIDKLNYAKRGYVGDYNYTGDLYDFELFKIHAAISKAIDLLESIE